MDQTKTSTRRAPTPKKTPGSAAPVPVPAPALVPAPAAASQSAADTEAVADGAAQEWVNRRASAQATRAANARQASGRRRFVDPTTCEREYSSAEMEFMQAMQDYKLSSGRMFPTWSEVLEVLKALGYEKPESLAAVNHNGLATAQPA